MKLSNPIFAVAMIVVMAALALLCSTNTLAISSEYCSDGCTNINSNIFVGSQFDGPIILSINSTNVTTDFAWPNYQSMDFMLRYDTASQKMIFQLDNKILEITNVKDLDMNQLIIAGYASPTGGNSLQFADMTLDGKSIPDLNVYIGDEALKVDFDNPAFVLKGKIIMANDQNDAPGFKIMMQKVEVSKGHGHGIVVEDNANSNADDQVIVEDFQDNQDNEVPEFGVIAGAIALIGAIIIFTIKRKKD